MNTETETETDPVEELLDEISCLLSSPDPLVLLFEGDEQPVVANVRGELRALSDAMIYAREFSEDNLRDACEQRGTPAVVPFSTQAGRFYKSDFDDLHPSEVTEA